MAAPTGMVAGRRDASASVRVGGWLADSGRGRFDGSEDRRSGRRRGPPGSVRSLERNRQGRARNGERRRDDQGCWRHPQCPHLIAVTAHRGAVAVVHLHGHHDRRRLGTPVCPDRARQVAHHRGLRGEEGRADRERGESACQGHGLPQLAFVIVVMPTRYFGYLPSSTVAAIRGDSASVDFLRRRHAVPASGGDRRWSGRTESPLSFGSGVSSI